MDKYKFTNESIKFEGQTLYRIELLKDLEIADGRKLKAGDKGGFISKDKNCLSQEGNCWVADGAKVLSYDQGALPEEKEIDCSCIRGNALVSGNAVVRSSYLSDDVMVSGQAEVSFSELKGHDNISGHAKVAFCQSPEKDGVSESHNRLSGYDVAMENRIFVVRPDEPVQVYAELSTETGENFKFKRDRVLEISENERIARFPVFIDNVVEDNGRKAIVRSKITVDFRIPSDLNVSSLEEDLQKHFDTDKTLREYCDNVAQALGEEYAYRDQPYMIEADELGRDIEDGCRAIRQNMEQFYKGHLREHGREAGIAKEPIMGLDDVRKGKPWYELRDKSLTNKDAAALMGTAPWCTREELMARKRKFVTTRIQGNTPEKRKVDRGSELQKVEAGEWKEIHGQRLRSGAVYQSDTRPYMIAKVPFFNEKGEPVITISTGHENKRFWEDGKLPGNVKDEALWMAAVMEAKKVHVICAIDNMNNEWRDMSKKWEAMKGVEQSFELREVSAVEPANKKRIDEMFEAAEKFHKEVERPYLVIGVPKDAVNKKDASYEVDIATGVKVTIPQDKVKQAKDGYNLVLPVKNAKGQSYMFKQENGKALSAGEIYCKKYHVRGQLLFANNRVSLKQRKNKVKATENTAGIEMP